MGATEEVHHTMLRRLFAHNKHNKTATYLLSLLLTVKMSIYSK